MSLNRRLNKLEEQQTKGADAVHFWGPPRTDEERQSRLDAGLTPAKSPQYFWTPTTDPNQSNDSG